MAADKILITTATVGNFKEGPDVSTINGSANVGEMRLYAGTVAPTYWLMCNSTMYAALFAVIGTTFGSGNGTTTFNIPDMRGRAPIGVGTGIGLTARALAATGGAESGVSVTLEGTKQEGAAATFNAVQAVTNPMPIMQPFIALNFIIFAGV